MEVIVRINAAAADGQLQTMLATRTGRSVGMGEAPKNPSYPFYVLAVRETAPFYGSMGNPLDMGDLAYTLTCVGKNNAQAGVAEDRAVQALDEFWSDVAVACGTPQVARRGTVRVQDNLWQSTLSITMKVSAS
jgi:hypothetical protein